MKKTIRNDNTYHVHGWMINLLKLSGLQLDLFAIIYGFSQDGESEFYGSLSYMQAFCNASKNGVLNALRALESKGLISKRYVTEEKVRRAKYKACLIVVDKAINDGFFGPSFPTDTGSSVSGQGAVHKVDRGSSVTAPGVVHKMNSESKRMITNKDSYTRIQERKQESEAVNSTCQRGQVNYEEFRKKCENMPSGEYAEELEEYLLHCSFDDLIEYGIDISAYSFDVCEDKGIIRNLLKEWLKILKIKGAPMTNTYILKNLEVLADTAGESGLSVTDYLCRVISRGYTSFYLAIDRAQIVADKLEERRRYDISHHSTKK